MKERNEGGGRAVAYMRRSVETREKKTRRDSRSRGQRVWAVGSEILIIMIPSFLHSFIHSFLHLQSSVSVKPRT